MESSKEAFWAHPASLLGGWQISITAIAKEVQLRGREFGSQGIDVDGGHIGKSIEHKLFTLTGRD